MTDSVPQRRHAKSARAADALTSFYGTPLSAALTRCLSVDPAEHALELFKSAAARVPAYRRFLASHGIEAAQVRTLDDFRRLPVTTKETYHRPNALADLCLDGNLAGCDMLAMSSGSSGEPTVWPRFVADELGSAERFEQVLADGFEANQRSTLTVVCFALGTWVGGMYTAACCRHVATKGYPITVVTPGNQKPEILRVLRSLAPLYEQIVLCGYPPFLKDLIDEGNLSGFPWARHALRIVLAGEVFSESWRTLVCERIGAANPAHASASLYGTADGGVLANETPLSITIRRFLAEHPATARELFGDTRLPTLCQYDPLHRYFEREEDGSLLFSAGGSAPLLRYKILDRGGIVPYAQMIAFLKEHGCSPEASP
ncbi:MAG TPA: phenylacetate--CoA ligase family protein, partial [Polyangiaceae bacterium]|nr:phenylacetate--CoA ligase family protein [Polyangiaceae bacterium]